MNTAVLQPAPPLPTGAHRVDAPGRDPLDDAVYVFSAAGRDPYPYARFAGHLPALRLPPPRPGRLLTRTTARQALIVWSVVDLWAFVATLRLGPGPLAPVALLGLVATCWHLRTSARRRSPVVRQMEAPGPVLRPVGTAAARRHDTGRPGHRLHRTFSPRRVRPRWSLLGMRLPSGGRRATVTPALCTLAASLVAGAVMHVGIGVAGLLH